MARNLHGMQLVISVACFGLKTTTNQLLTDATVSRASDAQRVGHVTKRRRPTIVARLRVIDTKQRQSTASDQLDQSADFLEAHWRKVAGVL